MRVHRVLLTVALAAAVGCGTQDDADPGSTPGAEVAPPPPAPVEQAGMSVATGQFEASGDDGMQVSGTTELRRQGAAREDGMELHVRIMGLSEGEHAWHIHQGSCDNRGSPVLALSDAPGQDGVAGDLDPDENGIAERTVSLDADDVAQLTGGGAYSVNVHARGSDSPGPSIACATLELPADLWSGAAPAEPGTTPTGN